MELIEKTKKSELIFEGKVVRLYKDTVELTDGNTSEREYIKHIGAVCVIPVTDDGEIILERQYRYAVGLVLDEIPAGKLNSADEDPKSAALRELAEETGAVPSELVELGDYYGTPAIAGERIRMFLAKGLSFGSTNRDDGEFMEVYKIPLKEAVKKVMQGEFPDGKTQAAILRAAIMLGEIPPLSSQL